MRDYQKFRFCCGCQRVALINFDQSCYFCGSKFIVQGLKSDLHDRNISEFYKRRNARRKEINNLKNETNETLPNQETYQGI